MKFYHQQNGKIFSQTSKTIRLSQSRAIYKIEYPQVSHGESSAYGKQRVNVP